MSRCARFICLQLFLGPLLVVLGGSRSTAQAQSPQYFAGTGHWYQVFDANSAGLTWLECKVLAENAGGYLATPLSAAENDFIVSLTPVISSGTTVTYIGGTNIDGGNTWAWITGEAWNASFAPWYPGQPDDACVPFCALAVYGRGSCCSGTGKWVDYPPNDGSNTRSYVVEYDNNCALGALQFDGANDEVLVPDSPSLRFAPGNPMTIECWIRPGFSPTSQALLARRAGLIMNYQLSFGGGVFDFFSPGSTRVRENYTPPTDVWTHVAGTYDGTTSHLYVNGSEVGTPSPYGTVNNAADLTIGGAGSDPPFIGQVDEVRLWNVARSGAEIAANYASTVDPNAPGLAGYWRFDEQGENQTVFDLSSEGNHGTLGTTSGAGSDDPIRVASAAPLVDCSPADSCYDTGDWAQLSPQSSPSPRRRHSMVYDVQNQEIMLYGGHNGSHLGETWIWKCSTWSQVSPVNSPGNRDVFGMTYHDSLHETVLFGGSTGSTFLNDSWVWDGTDWTQKSPNTVPQGRNHHSLVYDAARRRTVMFGGMVGQPEVHQNDTWTWNGTNWTQMPTSAQPSPRRAHGMAYDRKRQRVVLFGGTTGGGIYVNDTWEWDGSVWNQRFPANSPPGRDLPLMTYDVSRERVILFGGNNNPTFHGDTWVWDGTNWAMECETAPPVVREAPGFAYEPNLGGILMFGGYNGTYFNDTWLWKSPSSCLVMNFDPLCPASCDSILLELKEENGVTVIDSRKVRVGGLLGFDVVRAVYNNYAAAPPAGFTIGLVKFQQNWSGVKLCRDG